MAQRADVGPDKVRSVPLCLSLYMLVHAHDYADLLREYLCTHACVHACIHANIHTASKGTCALIVNGRPATLLRNCYRRKTKKYASLTQITCFRISGIGTPRSYVDIRGEDHTPWHASCCTHSTCIHTYNCTHVSNSLLEAAAGGG